MSLHEPNNSDERQAFLFGLADFIEKTVHSTGFGRSGLVIEVAKNGNGVRKYALIHEGAPSQRYVLTQEQIEGLITFLKSLESSHF